MEKPRGAQRLPRVGARIRVGIGDHHHVALQQRAGPLRKQVDLVLEARVARGVGKDDDGPRDPAGIRPASPRMRRSSGVPALPRRLGLRLPDRLGIGQGVWRSLGVVLSCASAGMARARARIRDRAARMNPPFCRHIGAARAKAKSNHRPGRARCPGTARRHRPQPRHRTRRTRQDERQDPKLARNGRKGTARPPAGRSDMAHAGRHPGQTPLHRGGHRRVAAYGQPAGAGAVHARRQGHDVCRPALDDPPICGLFHRRGKQRLLPQGACRRAAGCFRGLRPRHASRL